MRIVALLTAAITNAIVVGVLSGFAGVPPVISSPLAALSFVTIGLIAWAVRS